MITQSEEEQLEDLKGWWAEHGKAIIIGILVAIAILAVWNFWKKRQETNRMRASVTYQQLIGEIEKPTKEIKSSAVNALAGQLQVDAPDSGYAQYAKLIAARVAVDNGAIDEAVNTLKAILNKPTNPVVEELARQKVAQLLMAQDKNDEALKLLNAPVEKAFTVSRNELKGDVLLKQGNSEGARAAYNEALAAAKAEASANTLIIQLKLDDIAKGDA